MNLKQENNIKLSIVIPTFNRSKFLAQTLLKMSEIVSSEGDGICEIVVSDNCSTDNTEAVCKEYNAKYACIKYFKNEINLGYDSNVILGAARARGGYIWFFGDDDIPVPGAVKKIFNVLNTNKNISIIQLNYDIFDGNTGRKTVSRLVKNKLDSLFQDRNEALQRCSFVVLSSIVVKRQFCLDTPKRSEYIGSGFIHLYFAVNALCNGSCYYVEKPYIQMYTNVNPEGLDQTEYFVYNLTKIYKKCLQMGFSAIAVRYVLNKRVKDIFKDSIYYYAVKKYPKKNFFIFFTAFADLPLFWGTLFLFFLIPGFLIKLIYIAGKYYKDRFLKADK